MGIIYLLDKNEQTRELPNIVSAKHTQSLNRESVIELISADPVDKYEHLIYQDESGDWHEFIVDGCVDLHDEGGIQYEVFGSSVLTELTGDWIDDRRIVDLSATTALERALLTTRWQVGTVTVTGNGTVNFYRESAYSALGKIVRTWDAELRARIVVTDGRVTGRYIDLLDRIGSDTGARFEWTRNILSVRREILRADVITALHGYGRGEEIGDGFGRRISFAAINDGLDYVADEDARRQYGRVSTVRSWEALSDRCETWADVEALGLTWQQLYDSTPYSREHRHGKIEFDDLTDPAAIKQNTIAALDQLSKPQATYSAKVTDFAALGLPQVGLGDGVVVIDDDLGIETMLRVVEIKRDPLTPLTDEITLGQFQPSVAGRIVSQDRILSDLRSVYGVTRMVSLDGRSWIDYSIPEIVLDSDIGKLRIGPDVIFQLLDTLGQMVAGFVDLDGRKGLMVPFLGNSAEGTSGVGTVGGGPTGGVGYRFSWGDHTYFLTFDVSGGVQLYIDDHLRQAWDSTGGHTLYDLEGKRAFDISGTTGEITMHDKQGKKRLVVDDNGGAVAYNQFEKVRMWILPDGSTRIYDQNEKIRFHILATGENEIVAPNGQQVFLSDANKSEIIAPTASGSKLGCDATGPYKVVGGVKTYL